MLRVILYGFYLFFRTLQIVLESMATLAGGYRHRNTTDIGYNDFGKPRGKWYGD